MKQVEKIVTLMCHNKQRTWFYPPDFMKPELGPYFVGYEASARLSELASKYPDMIESLRKGKYVYRRIRWESYNEWKHKLPENLFEIVRKA